MTGQRDAADFQTVGTIENTFCMRRVLGKYVGRLSASASSHPSLSLADFTTNIAESDFRYTHAHSV
jgi:hypothetical protein